MLALAAAACQQTASPPATTAAVPDVQLVTQAAQLVPALATTDSVLFIFYNNPYKGDAERYTRYYKQVGSRADSALQLVKQALAIPFVRQDTLRSCRSEGKIFCFAAGRPVQTLYFSRQSEACTHLYLIHEGRYYYWQPGSAFFAALDALKPLARSWRS
jgi:hypothetical protein